jgi:AcrR family transcriptional regulator
MEGWMIAKEMSRMGGRSARIQASVHRAVDELSREMDRSEITVPVVAARAGVPPSTIYRRWGSLTELLADVAVRHLRPAADPLDTGDLRSDLQTWIEQYMDEMSSEFGRTLLRDVLADPFGMKNVRQCAMYLTRQLEIIAARGERRGDRRLDVAGFVDHVVAPVVYRILFGLELDAEVCRTLIERHFETARVSDRPAG